MCLGPGLQTPGSEPRGRGAGDEFLGSLKLSFCICNIGMVLYPGGLEWDSDLARWSSGQVTPSFYSPGLPCMRKHPGPRGPPPVHASHRQGTQRTFTVNSLTEAAGREGREREGRLEGPPEFSCMLKLLVLPGNQRSKEGVREEPRLH